MLTIPQVIYSRYTSREQIAATLRYLRQCCKRRDAVKQHPDAAAQYGATVSYTNDPAWLVNIAINRRAGWPDDPSEYRGSAMPIASRDGWASYPKQAQGNAFATLRRLSMAVNTPRLIVRSRDCPKRYQARLSHRLAWPSSELY